MSSNRSRSTKALTEGALFAALTVLLYVVNIYTRVLVYFLPVPAAVITFRHGLRTGVMATLAAAFGVMAILGPLDALVVLVTIGIIGITLGLCLRQGFSWVASIGVTSIAVVVAFVISFVVGALVVNLSPMAMVRQIEQTFIDTIPKVMEMYRNMGIRGEALENAEKTLGMFLDVMRVLFPSMLLIASTILAGVTYAGTRLVLSRMRQRLDPIPPFSTWIIPWYWAWGFILSILVAIAGQYTGIRAVSLVGANGVRVFQMLFMVQGLSVAWFFLDKYKVPRGFRFVIAFMLLYTPMLPDLLAYAGIFDGWFDFRRLRRR